MVKPIQNFFKQKYAQFLKWLLTRVLWSLFPTRFFQWKDTHVQLRQNIKHKGIGFFKNNKFINIIHWMDFTEKRRIYYIPILPSSISGTIYFRFVIVKKQSNVTF